MRNLRFAVLAATAAAAAVIAGCGGGDDNSNSIQQVCLASRSDISFAQTASFQLQPRQRSSIRLHNGSLPTAAAAKSDIRLHRRLRFLLQPRQRLRCPTERVFTRLRPDFYCLSGFV